MPFDPHHIPKCCLLSLGFSSYLLGAVEPWVTQALSGDHVTDAVITVAAVVFTILAVSAVGAANLTPTARTKNFTISAFNKKQYVSLCNSYTKNRPWKEHFEEVNVTLV